MTSTRSAWIRRLLLVGLILWGLHLPLHDLLTYPDRISVLPNLQADADVAPDSTRRHVRRSASQLTPLREEGYSVEFLDMTGNTVAVVTVPASVLRVPTPADRPAVRALGA